MKRMIRLPFNTKFGYHLKLVAQYSNRGADSPKWLQRQANDPYVKRARIESYRCRSAFKLLEIDNYHKLFPTRDGPVHVLDLGAAPGSWTQVVLRKLRPLEEIANHTDNNQSMTIASHPHLIVALDILDIGSLPGAHCLSHVDIRNVEHTLSLIRQCHYKHYHLSPEPSPCEFDLVISDMAPNASGHKEIDMIAIVELAKSALKIALHLLRPDGKFLCKLWAGTEQREFENLLKRFFKTVQVVKPPSSRGDSAEIFYLARGFHLGE